MITVRPVHRTDRSGFTLVEVLVALGLFAVVSTLLYGALRGISTARDIFEDRLRTDRRALLLLDRIATDLQGAVATTNGDTVGIVARDDSFGDAKASSVTFTAFTLPSTGSSRPSSGLVKRRYFPKIAEDGRRIDIHLEESELPRVTNKVPPRETRIAEGLTSFRVEWLDGDKWVGEWPPSEGKAAVLPYRARVTVVDAREERFVREVSLPLAGQEGALLNSGRRTRTTP